MSEEEFDKTGQLLAFTISEQNPHLPVVSLISECGPLFDLVMVRSLPFRVKVAVYEQQYVLLLGLISSKVVEQSYM